MVTERDKIVSQGSTVLNLESIVAEEKYLLFIYLIVFKSPISGFTKANILFFK